jgi:hypothetical protein
MSNSEKSECTVTFDESISVLLWEAKYKEIIEKYKEMMSIQAFYFEEFLNGLVEFK